MVILESIQVYNFFCGSKMRKRGRRWTIVDPSVIPGSLGSPRRCDRVEGSKQKAGGTTRGSGGSPGTPSWTLDAIYNPPNQLSSERGTPESTRVFKSHTNTLAHIVSPWDDFGPVLSEMEQLPVEHRGGPRQPEAGRRLCGRDVGLRGPHHQGPQGRPLCLQQLLQAHIQGQFFIQPKR